MRLAILVIATLVFTGCTGSPNDPAGMTTRTQINADAQVAVAEADARAAEVAAEQARIARETEAVQQRIAQEAASAASVQIAEQEAYATVKVNEYWSTTLIWVLALVVLGGIYALYLNWKGRITMAVVTRPALPNTDPTGGEPVLTVRDFKMLGGTQFDIVLHSESGEWYGMRDNELHRLVDFSPKRGL